MKGWNFDGENELAGSQLKFNGHALLVCDDGIALSNEDALGTQTPGTLAGPSELSLARIVKKDP